MPVTSRRLAFMIDGAIYDIDTIEALIERHSPPGFTAVLHLKNEVDVVAMFSKYFDNFKINDYSEVREVFTVSNIIIILTTVHSWIDLSLGRF